MNPTERLKSHFATISEHLEQHAWILLLGPKSAGKTQLLAQSGLPLNSPANKDIATQTETPFVDWWLTSNAVFIDPAGDLTAEEWEDQKPLWEQLIQFGKQYCKRYPIQEIVVVADATSIANQDTLTKTHGQLSRAMQLLKTLQKHISVSIIITQCDAIAGFTAFFNDLDEIEREKQFGILNSGQQAITFDPLLDTINAQLLSRLHREPNTERRQLIQQFPIQFSMLTEKIHTLLQELPLDKQVSIEGVFFTSSRQKHPTVDFISDKLKHTVQVDAAEPSTAIGQQKPYFIKQLMQHVVNNAVMKHAQHTQRSRWSLIAMGSAMAVLLVLTLFWHYAYQDTRNVLSTLNQNIIQQTKNQRNTSWLKVLDTLHNSLETLHHPSIRVAHYLGFNQPKKLRNRVNLLYNTQLQTRFIPFIESTITHAMLENMYQNPLDLYQASVAYLMLINKQHYQKARIIDWFSANWKAQYPHQPEIQHSLLSHLNVVLDNNRFNWPKNPEVISEAISTLQALPPEAFNFLVLQTQFQGQQSAILKTKETRPAFNLSHILIPSLYDPENFQLIFNSVIPNIVTHPKRSRWIFGNENDVSLDEKSTEMIAAVRQLYLNQFSREWLKQIPKIALTTPNSFTDIQMLILNMITQQSEFRQFLTVIAGNTALSHDSKTLKTQNYQAINHLIAQDNTYKKLSTQLTDLQHYLQKLQTSGNINTACYHESQALLNHQTNPIATLLDTAKTLPNPLRDWVNTIAYGSLNVIFSHARTYLNSIWSTTVLPDYNENLQQRFPLWEASDVDLSLNAFTHFFGTKGTIDIFFTQYLTPFVDMSTKIWHWKSIDGKTIGIPNDTLDVFMRASIIQKMFFTDDHKAPSFKYLLTLNKTSDAVYAVTINMEGQMLIFGNKQSQQQVLNWPGPDPGRITLQLNTAAGQTQVQHFSGPWAWFHFINSMRRTVHKNTQKLLLEMNLQDNKATFDLTMDHKVNPAIPHVLSAFRCPKIL